MAKKASQRNRFRTRRMGQESFQKIFELAIAIIAGILGYLLSVGSGTSNAVFTLLRSAIARSSNIDSGTMSQIEQAIREIIIPIQTALSFVIALLSSLVALLITQTSVKFMNTRREGFVTKLYATSESTLDFLEEFAGHAETFAQNLRATGGEFAELFADIWKKRAENYLGVIQNLSEFDVDVDSHSEVVFTKSLVDIATSSIDAIAAEEQKFWGSDIEAEAYFDEQVKWLQSNKSRRIRRIFVLSEPKGGVAEETIDKLSSSKKIVDRHFVLTGKGEFEALKDRYEWRLISWKDWFGVVKIREDLIIYDNKYVRRGLIVSEGGSTELRKAYFRANKSDVNDSIERFAALWLMASPPSRTLPPAEKTTETMNEAGRERNHGVRQ